MNKNFFPFYIFSALICWVPGTWADSQAPAPNGTQPVALNAPIAGTGGLINISDSDLDKIIQQGEATLRTLRDRHYQKEQKQHAKVTKKDYNQAVDLYQQHRLAAAQEAFKHVDYITAGYQSTDALIKNINEKDLEKLRMEVYRDKLIGNPQALANMTQEADGLYRQVDFLGDDGDTAVLRKKLSKLKEVLDKQNNMVASPKEAQKLYIQHQLDRIHETADYFDRQIFELTQAKNYVEAKKKYDEFQATMIEDLMELKQTMAE